MAKTIAEMIMISFLLFLVGDGASVLCTAGSADEAAGALFAAAVVS